MAIAQLFSVFAMAMVLCLCNKKSSGNLLGDDGIQAKLYQILKDEAIKVLHSVCQQIWKTRQ